MARAATTSVEALLPLTVTHAQELVDAVVGAAALGTGVQAYAHSGRMKLRPPSRRKKAPGELATRLSTGSSRHAER